jgi:hypothetical protein
LRGESVEGIAPYGVSMVNSGAERQSVLFFFILAGSPPEIS